MISRPASDSSQRPTAEASDVPLIAITIRFISGGIAASTWSVVPDGSIAQPPDQERLKTIDYGGGARWFAKPHLAFSFDVRFYAMDSSTPAPGLPGGPRTRLLVVGAGVSVK